MSRIASASLAAALALLAAANAWAHAFLDHASPPVGSAVPTAPPAVTLWFTQDLEPAFSNVVVTDASGQRVDSGGARIPPGSAATLEVAVKPLPPGTYTVTWHVVSVDTHPTEGSFTFTVSGR